MLTRDGLLKSDLWLDRPDALDVIERRFAAGEIDAQQAEALGRFVRDGYLTFTPRFPEGIFETLDADLERLWREQPSYVAYARNSLLTRFSGRDTEERRPAYRIADLHAFSEAARLLYLDATVHAWIELVFGEPAIATQSLYFEWGSQQALHRDPMHVRMEPPSHLLAAWIACEDIAPESGPLVYIPGSHRLPYYRFDGERYVFDAVQDGTEGILAAQAFDRERCESAGLAPRPFTPKRGEVLIWHHSLLHGGSTPVDPARTRKSFVVHFTTRAHKTSTSNTYLDPFVPSVVESSPTPRVYSTDRLLGALGPQGLDSPLHARSLAEPAELHRSIAHLVELVAERDATIARFRSHPFWRLRRGAGRVLRAVSGGRLGRGGRY